MFPAGTGRWVLMLRMSLAREQGRPSCRLSGILLPALPSQFSGTPEIDRPGQR